MYVLIFLFGTSLFSMSSSNCCFLTCIQVSQEAGQVVWYSHLFQNFPQFIVIHTVKGFGIVNKAEIDVFLELSCFFHDPEDAGNLISGSSAFSKTSLNIREFTVHVWITSLWAMCFTWKGSTLYWRVISAEKTEIIDQHHIQNPCGLISLHPLLGRSFHCEGNFLFLCFGSPRRMSLLLNLFHSP